MAEKEVVHVCFYVHILYNIWPECHQMMNEGVQSVAKFTAECFMKKKMLGRNMMAKLNDNK